MKGRVREGTKAFFLTRPSSTGASSTVHVLAGHSLTCLWSTVLPCPEGLLTCTKWLLLRLRLMRFQSADTGLRGLAGAVLKCLESSNRCFYDPVSPPLRPYSTPGPP